ncbi:MAG TPA: hypothetical protein VLK84_12455 [Longimicrobium sp.]|nr:hypothetical protein [Longimicrobium sp.]
MSDSTVAAPTEHMAIRGETWRTVAAVLFLLLALAGSQLVVTMKKMAGLQRDVSGSADSLQLARAYGPLVNEAFDLQQELEVRNTWVIPRVSSPVAPPPGAPPGLRPVPVFTTTEGTRDQEGIRALLASIPSSPQRGDIRIVIAQATPADARAAGTLRRLGFTIVKAPQEELGPLNAITFGDSVPLADVRLAAYALIEAGLPVKRVRSSSEDGSASRTLTISNVRWATRWPPLTSVQVERLRLPSTPTASR